MTSDLTTKEKREKIDRASNILSGHLSKLSQENNQKNREHIRIIKREIRTIIKQLAKLRDFCNKSTKNNITRISMIGAAFTTFHSIRMFCEKRRIIDLWASRVLMLNTGMDYNKWPLEFGVKLGVKIKDFLDAHFTVKTKRPT